jgi:PleD family two-component response regulator
MGLNFITVNNGSNFRAAGCGSLRDNMRATTLHLLLMYLMARDRMARDREEASSRPPKPAKVCNLPALGKPKILSISPDDPLLKTRELLLVREGFSVFSTHDINEALKRCRKTKFDLIVLGHSIPVKNKSLLAQDLKKICQTILLSIRRHGYRAIPEADCSVDAIDGPEIFLAAVKSALGLAN